MSSSPDVTNNQWWGEGAFFCLPRKLLYATAGKGVVDHATFRVFVALASCVFKDNPTHPGAEFLAKLTGIEVRNVARHLEAIVSLGLAERKPRKPRGYVYTLRIPERGTVRSNATALKKRKVVRKSALAPQTQSQKVQSSVEALGHVHAPSLSFHESPEGDDFGALPASRLRELGFPEDY